MKFKIFSLMAAFAMAVALSSTAKADTITDSFGDTWTVTATFESGNTWDVTVTLNSTNYSGSNPYLAGLAVIFETAPQTADPNVTSILLDPNDTTLLGGPTNPGNLGCADNSGPSACMNFNPGLTLGEGGIYSWTFDVTTSDGSLPPYVHIQATSDSCSDTTLPTTGPDHTCGGNNLISNDDGISHQVPEASSLILIGTGMLAMAGFMRRKFIA